MGDGTGRSVSNNATAAADAGDGFLLSAGLTAGADAATVTIRTGGASGTIVCKLGAAIGLTAQRTYVKGVPYSNLHVTVTGTTPIWEVELG